MPACSQSGRTRQHIEQGHREERAENAGGRPQPRPQLLPEQRGRRERQQATIAPVAAPVMPGAERPAPRSSRPPRRGGSVGRVAPRQPGRQMLAGEHVGDAHALLDDGPGFAVDEHLRAPAAGRCRTTPSPDHRRPRVRIASRSPSATGGSLRPLPNRSLVSQIGPTMSTSRGSMPASGSRTGTTACQAP